MKNNKNIIALSLATTLAMAPMTVLASEAKIEEAVNTVVEATVVEEATKTEEATEATEAAEVVEAKEEVIVNMEIADEDVLKTEVVFNSTIGKVESVNIQEDGKAAVLVEIQLEEGKTDKIIYLIGEETLLLNGEEKSVIEAKDLKEGMEVKTFFERNTPVATSLPAQMAPKVIVINNVEKHDVFVDRFNDELVNALNTLKLNVSEETEIVNVKGEKVEDIKNKDLVVFFGATTKSIPAQTAPLKIIVLDEKAEEVEEVEETEEEEKVEVELSHEKMIINGEEVVLEDEMYVLENTEMIPLREIVEKLGYEVKWNQEDFSIELTKDAQWSKVTIGENKYNFAKMSIELERAPELKAGKTFVPKSFLSEVLKLETVEMNAEGILEIK